MGTCHIVIWIDIKQGLVREEGIKVGRKPVYYELGMA